MRSLGACYRPGPVSGRRGVAMAATLLLSGFFAGCTSTTTTPPRFTGTPLAWLSGKAEPWNQRLNADQFAVDRASKASQAGTPAAYFAALRRACAAMADDVGKARSIPPAPTGALQGAWSTMLAETADYAESCVALTRTPSSSARLDRWNSSLTAMDRANAGFNRAVAQVRGTTSTTGG